jgi:hypothetical protein
MKFIVTTILFFLSLTCYSQNSDTVRIKNDTLEYEIVIIDPYFNFWLIGNARPRGFYGLGYLESYNRFYISNWNNRVMSSNYTDINIFIIDYDFNIKYGYEVNYLLFNYFQYYMSKTGQTLGNQRRYILKLL